MKDKWLWVSLGIGTFVAIGSYLFMRDLNVNAAWKIAVFIVFPLVTLIVLLRNPDYVFFRAFTLILFVFLALNKFFLQFSAKTEDYQFEFRSEELETPTNIVLLVLAGLALVLHFLKTGGALKGTWLEFNNNKVGDISGSNIHINQSNTKNQ